MKLTMVREVVIVSEDITRIKFASREELLDMLAMLHREQTGAIDFASLFNRNRGAQADPLAGGYASSVALVNGDIATTPGGSGIVYNTASAVGGSVSTTVGATARIWEHTIQPRTLKCWGSGPMGLINNQGYGFFVIMQTATGFDVGVVNLVVERQDRHVKEVVKAFLDSGAHLADDTSLTTATPTNNQTGMIAMPKNGMEKYVIAAPYSRLAIDYQTVSTVTENAADFRFPVTVKTG